MFGFKNNEKETMSHKLEALGRFAGGMAHDFNNILSIIDGCAHLALRELEGGRGDTAQIRRILAAAERGAGLTRQLLAFAREKVTLEETVDIGAFLDGLRVLLHPALGDGIKLHLMLPDAPLWVSASQDQLTQVFLNLALNARDAVNGRGEITVICTQHRRNGQDMARVSVVDNGRGIPKSALPHIFEPFFTTKAAGAGTGLGLSVVYGIVSQMKGHIDVVSEEGRGAAFEVFLPVAPPPRVMTPEEGEAPSLRGRTVLLAEDEDMLRDVLAVMLGNMELKVLPAANGNEAFRLLETYGGDIDFLLTDVVMPEMDGVRLGELFSRARPEGNVIYMSGYPFLDGGPFSLPPRAQFMSKPLQEEKVRKILERALQRRDERLGREGKDDSDS